MISPENVCYATGIVQLMPDLSILSRFVALHMIHEYRQHAEVSSRPFPVGLTRQLYPAIRHRLTLPSENDTGPTRSKIPFEILFLKEKWLSLQQIWKNRVYNNK
jgi:hypothetical protein